MVTDQSVIWIATFYEVVHWNPDAEIEHLLKSLNVNL